ncbi:MAG TPA: hypothetical protein VFV34_03245 [Blastocatellia bacterium]|nr:hypothetical protein [Blastocatellia bacterium]
MNRVTIRLLALLVIAPLYVIAAQEKKSATPAKQQEVVEFTDKTEVAGVILEGKYLVIHDPSKSEKGETCFYLYKYAAGGDPEQIALKEKPVVMFHCKPEERAQVKETVLTVGMSPKAPGLFELKGIQFRGSNVLHVLL